MSTELAHRLCSIDEGIHAEHPWYDVRDKRAEHPWYDVRDTGEWLWCPGISQADIDEPRDIHTMFDAVINKHGPALEQIDPTEKTACQSCGKHHRPTIFKGQPYCSDNCRKALGMERPDRMHNELHPSPEMHTELETRLKAVIAALMNYSGIATCNIEGSTIDFAMLNVDTVIEFRPDNSVVMKQVPRQ